MVLLEEAQLIDALPAEIVVVDLDGNIVRHNRNWDEVAHIGRLASGEAPLNYLTECDAAAARGDVDAPRIAAGLRRVLSAADDTFFTYYMCPISGRPHWFKVSISVVMIGGRRHAIVMHVDVTSLQSDTLTGLPNRAVFEAQALINLEAARAAGARTGILFVDLDRLKVINDSYGHRVGDAAVKALAVTLVREAGPNRVVARIGGDEFGVVLPVAADVEFVQKWRALFKSGISTTIPETGQILTVRASVGAAYYPENGATFSELLTAADRAMYKQKRAAAVA